ncbi:MAG: META domain-containing protein [Flavitalea sp.]
MKFIFLILLVMAVSAGCHQSRKASQPLAIATNDSLIMEPINPDILFEKLKRGIDFTASGNEPFWSLEINFDKDIHFKTLTGIDTKMPVPEGLKAMDANVTRYAGQTEKGFLIVQIAKQECINDMSGKKTEYSITIDFKNDTDKQYTSFKGCGQYISDYRLHDIWVLQKINKKKLKASDFIKGLPQIELNLTEKKVFGHSGCNMLHGSMEVTGKKIHFGQMITTRMSCNNMDFESSYINSISGRTVAYKIEPGKLYIQVNPDSVFVYQKTD